MIQARCLRELTLGSPSSPGRARHVSAASGLVVTESVFYVVADDEHHLAQFPVAGEGEGELRELFSGDLPFDRAARKAHKPDLEVLTRLPPFASFPTGALLALASGSRPNRRTGAVVALDATGAISGAPRLLDLSDAYLVLEREFSALNIEGAVISGEDLVLFQRGNRKHHANAMLHLSLSEVLGGIDRSGSLGRADRLAVRTVELGDAGGIALGVTDAAALPDGRIVFAAAAEDTQDSYLDGPCGAAAIGLLTCEGDLQGFEPLQPTHKIEGIHAWLDATTIKLLLVTDADDEAVPSRLLAAEWRASTD